MYNTKHNRMNQAGWSRYKAQQNRERKAERLRRSDPLFQSGRIQSPFGLLLDQMLVALPPGRRVSASGRTYYERRANRSDRSRNHRL